MIVRQDEEGLSFFEQDRHAHLSGVFAAAWNEDLFAGTAWKDSVCLAVTQHDRGWASLDREIVTDGEKGMPLSFTDYPLKRKISVYKSGVDELLRMDPYSALLVSLHYASFFKGKRDPDGTAFMISEQRRQQQIRKHLGANGPSEEALSFHFDLLQLCDNLSLYLCMNRWGVKKEDEMPWFKNGFPQRLAPLRGRVMEAKFNSANTVTISPYPFLKDAVSVTIPYKYVRMKDVNTTGSKVWNKAYERAPQLYHSIAICR
ncbi:DUF3891 family protein [Alteribacter lacisalsi]|jgi:hypothetical protein|nr:DUF3891 family protein [Alteribacter lacisalsi]